MLSAAMMTLAVGCGEEKAPEEPPVTFDVDTVTAETTEEETTEPETTETETEIETETETEPESTEPEFINPLTGLEADKDLATRRPAAIMINNIKIATPQEGVSCADVMYECIVEGWQTRLMMLSMEYEDLPVVGSVRSSREYYLDFAANHDAIYIHAGGSQTAYAQIKSRKVDHLDGVNGPSPKGTFYRDETRWKKMGMEHSLMTTGEGIASGIEAIKCRTTLKDGFESPLNFVEYGTTRVPSTGDATFLKVKFSGQHQPYFEYNEDEHVYYRWQFLGDKHMDNTANKQLSFTNVIVMYLPTVSTKDDYNHMDVTTTGKGEGYYLTEGKYEKITWQKDGKDIPVKLYNEAGEELIINRGKTFFEICTTAMKDTTEIK